jgi:hypothetical protein
MVPPKEGEDAPYKPHVESEDEEEEVGALTKDDEDAVNEAHDITKKKPPKKQNPDTTSNQNTGPRKPKKTPNTPTKEGGRPKSTHKPAKSGDRGTNAHTPTAPQAKPSERLCNARGIYKGEIPWPMPSDFNPATSKRRRFERGDDAAKQPPPKKYRADEPHHDTRIDGVKITGLNTSWLMRLSQLKGLPARPPHDPNERYSLHIALIDQLEDKQAEDDALWKGYDATQRRTESPEPTVGAGRAEPEDIEYEITVDINKTAVPNLARAILRALARKGIILADNELSLYASTEGPNTPDDVPVLLAPGKSNSDAKILSQYLDGEWQTVYVWKKSAEMIATLKKDEEKRAELRAKQKAKAAAAEAEMNKKTNDEVKDEGQEQGETGKGRKKKERNVNDPNYRPGESQEEDDHELVEDEVMEEE